MSSHLFNKHTTAQEVVDAFPASVEGKFIVVTGVVPGGIGYETVHALSTKAPRLVVITGRNQAKLDKVVADIQTDTPSVLIKSLLIDLASLTSVRAGAESIKALGTPDILINNAGVMMCPYTTTAEGFEMQLGTNYIGHYMLTRLLLPDMLTGPEPRVVNVSSLGHLWGQVRWDDPGFENGKVYSNLEAYGQSKTALNLFTVYLAQKYGNQGLVAISLHPGGIATELQRYVTDQEKQMWKEAANAYHDDLTPNMESGVWKTLEQGASTTLVAALDPKMKEHNGSYLVDCQPALPLPPTIRVSALESASYVAPFSIDKSDH